VAMGEAEIKSLPWESKHDSNASAPFIAEFVVVTPMTLRIGGASG
jgi:hypothetical protein